MLNHRADTRQQTPVGDAGEANIKEDTQKLCGPHCLRGATKFPRLIKVRLSTTMWYNLYQSLLKENVDVETGTHAGTDSTECADNNLLAGFVIPRPSAGSLNQLGR